MIAVVVKPTKYVRSDRVPQGDPPGKRCSSVALDIMLSDPMIAQDIRRSARPQQAFTVDSGKMRGTLTTQATIIACHDERGKLKVRTPSKSLVGDTADRSGMPVEGAELDTRYVGSRTVVPGPVHQHSLTQLWLVRREVGVGMTDTHGNTLQLVRQFQTPLDSLALGAQRQYNPDIFLRDRDRCCSFITSRALNVVRRCASAPTIPQSRGVLSDPDTL